MKSTLRSKGVAVDTATNFAEPARHKASAQNKEAGSRTKDLNAEDIDAALALTGMRKEATFTRTDLEIALAMVDLKGHGGSTSPEKHQSADTNQTSESRLLRSALKRTAVESNRTTLNLFCGQSVSGMAPKTTPSIDKQNRILAYLQSSLTVHTIKDLEKTLPSVASINGMVVKDFLQALSDDGKIRVEKIGSGNWYWSFASEEKKARENVLAKLQDEKMKVDAALQELQGRVKEASALKGDDPDRERLVEERLVLEHEIATLRKELEGYKDGDPGEVERRRKEIAGLKSRAERWSDNIGILEGQMLNSMGGDRERLDGVKREVYGDEYVEGEGLREL